MEGPCAFPCHVGLRRLDTLLTPKLLDSLGFLRLIVRAQVRDELPHSGVVRKCRENTWTNIHRQFLGKEAKMPACALLIRLTIRAPAVASASSWQMFRTEQESLLRWLIDVADGNFI